MAEPARYDGHDERSLAALLAVPRLVLRESVVSTMDVAHELARDGVPAGTVVIAEHQTAGRGRGGRVWASAAGRGIWLTLLERPNDPAALDVLSLRLGLRAARVLDRFAAEPVRLKWPNDLFAGGGKVAGILVEARWREGRIDWVAIGVGINVRPAADVPGAGVLRADASRAEVLAELVPALRAAAAARGGFSSRELEEFAARDLARGRRCSAPAAGTVRGVTPAGELVIETAQGALTFRGGSLLLDEGIP